MYVQDAAAHLAVAVSGIEPGMRVLDCCAAPGGKSFAAALQMQDRGTLYSCDIHPHRLELIERGAERLGISILETHLQDASQPVPAWRSAMAGVLADAGAFERRGVLATYGFASGMLFGLLMNTWTLAGFVQPVTWPVAVGVYVAALPFDLVHSVATVGFLLVIYVPWRKKLMRVKEKFAL